MKRIIYLILFLVAGCCKNHLYVQVENIDRDFLASTHVDTPDYRQKDPPYGQRILVSWDFPKNFFEENLFVYLTVRFWDNEEKLEIAPLKKKYGTLSFYFPNKNKEKKKKILTYQINVKNKKGEIIETWEHQFWTELVDVDKEE